MNISYKQLQSYIPTTLTPEEVASALTSIGLETGGIEEYESIPGGLRGLVIGEVLTCIPHENSDHLHITTVSIGEGEPLQIVCGASNVAVGHAVVVATIGTVLGEGENSFTIKKGKIRGVESFGMLCAETEIGVGSDDSGIILLPLESVRIGMPAAEYFGIESDHVLEVDITPNRVDATSHFGVARDLAAYLSQKTGHKVRASLPQVQTLTKGESPLSVLVEADEKLVPRFESVVITGLKVGESPEWLRHRLLAIGQKPINVVVDVTNFVLHEFGQPLHAYDLAKVGSGLVVREAREGEKITTLDGTERQLSQQDILIASREGKALCIGGVMGGLDSGTTTDTTAIVLEAASFNASSVRHTARRLGLSTDSSFRFERGLDPERTHWALERATTLILELCEGSRVEGAVADHYPVPSLPYEVEVSLARMARLMGKTLECDTILSILDSLEISVLQEQGDVLRLAVPRYRIDVTREVDIVEELMRIYGYNNIELSGYVNASLSSESVADRSYRRRLMISEQLTGAGFNEILCNSLSSEAFYSGLQSFPAEQLVRLVNPLSAELGVMRQTLLFGGLQSIARNLRRQSRSFYFYEWGNCYSYAPAPEGDAMRGYNERLALGLWIGGKRVEANWAHRDEASSPYELKAHVSHILRRLAINTGLIRYDLVDCDLYEGKAFELRAKDGRLIGRMGQVKASLLALHDIDLPIYYAELEWEILNALAERAKITINELPKFPIVRRDLSLLLDNQVAFSEIEAIAYKTEKRLLKRCELFDVYEGKNLPAGKKSYAVAFYLQDENATMSDTQIEGIMSKIQKNLEAQLSASLR